MARKLSSPAQEFANWQTSQAYVVAYRSVVDELAIATELVKARTNADMTQEQVAAAMGTTQTVVARLESGRGMPSTRTLQRYALATKTRLRISFEPKTHDGQARQ